MYINVGLK